MSDNNTKYPIDEKNYRYQIALKSMNIGTWEWNIQTDELIFDDRYAEMLGYQKEELLPTTVDLWRKLIHEDDLQKALDEIDNHFQNHTEYYDIEFRLRHKDGNYIWVLSKGRVTEFDENGYPLKMFGAHLDITDSKTLEKINLSTKYNNLIENAPYPVIVTNYKTGLVTYGNERARQLFGVNFEQAINKTALDFYVNPSDRDQFINNLHEKHNVSDFEVQLYKSYREKFWALIYASFTLFNDELSVLITINDITRRKEIEIDLNSEKNKYQLLAESMADVIMVFNLNTLNFSYISPSVFDLRGLTVEEAHQEKFDDIIFVNDRVNILNNLRNDAQKYLENPDLKKTTIYEFQEYCKNGRLVWVEASFKFRINENRDVEIISTHRNIDERKKIESRIEYMNLHELNTGLLNKTAFRFYQDKWANQSDLKFSIIYVDLDHFGKINDAIGHLAGDQIIVDISKRLKELIQNEGDIYHYVGDEFIIIYFNTNEDVLKGFTQRINKSVTQQVVLKDYSYLLTCSIGYAIAQPNETIEQVFKKSSIALLKAKQVRNSIIQYNDEFSNKITKEIKLEEDLHYALERNQLELYYQPIYNVSTGRIDKAEALLRWNHPEYGIVSPIDFIPIAERTRLILPITDWIIHQACRTLAEWDHNEYPLTLSINISFITINNRGEELYNLLKRELIATGINPDRLKFEITETSLVQDTAEVIRVFIRLKELGLKLALDDFGTGYSSFGYLKALPLDIVKIDRSLIRNLEVDNKSRMIVESMITVLHGLNLEVIVEGIETVGQYEILESMKADAIQGYLFSKPIRISEFKEYYQNAINDDFLPVKNRTKDDVEIVLHWRNEWNSGHPTIDDQHKILMKLAADLERCVLLECSNQQVITDQIDHILEELKKHFHDEEEILLKNSFPQYLEHQIEHQRLINQFNHLYDLYQKDEVNAYSFVKYIVREIIWEHLLKEDMKFFPYVTKVPSNQAINYIPTYFSEDNDLRENRDLLNFNLNLQTLLTNVSLLFINVDLKNYDEKVNYALKRCGNQVGADRVYIFKYDWNNKTTSNTFEWCQEGIEPQIDELQSIPFEAVPDWVNAHSQGETIFVPNVKDLEVGSGLREILEPQGIKSLLTVPMINDNICYGFIGFDSVKKKHIYTEFEIAILKELSGVLLSAMKRKELEEKVQNEKEFYELAISSLNEGLIVTNEDFLITYVNEVAEKVLNRFVLDIRGQDIRSIFKPISLTTKETIELDWMTIKESKSRIKIDDNLGFIQRNGQMTFIGGTITSIQTMNQFKGILIHFRDVSLKVEGYEQIEAFLGLSQELLCVADYDGHFVRVNKHFTDVLGYSIEELEGKYFLDLVHPEDVVRTLNFIKDERIKGKVHKIENRYLTKDGQFKKIHWTVKAGYARYMYAIAKVVKE